MSHQTHVAACKATAAASGWRRRQPAPGGATKPGWGRRAGTHLRRAPPEKGSKLGGGCRASGGWLRVARSHVQTASAGNGPHGGGWRQEAAEAAVFSLPAAGKQGEPAPSRPPPEAAAGSRYVTAGRAKAPVPHREGRRRSTATYRTQPHLARRARTQTLLSRRTALSP